jgi:hypothetical protein
LPGQYYENVANNPLIAQITIYPSRHCPKQADKAALRGNLLI